MNLTDAQIINETQKQFDQELHGLDSQTLRCLRDARNKALAQLQEKKSVRLKWLTGAGAGLAIAGVLTFMVAPNLFQLNKLSPLDDLEILASEADMDIVTQLDFYVWLDESFTVEVQ